MVGAIKETSAVGFNKCISAEGRGWDNRCYHGWLDDIGRGDNTSAPVVLFVIGCRKWCVGHGRSLWRWPVRVGGSKFCSF